MTTADAIAFLRSQIEAPETGLHLEVFYFVSSLTPLGNVDLLIQDRQGQTLLAWRDDEFCGSGWHVPGGIVRARETMETRIQKVAYSEIGCEVRFDPTPLTIRQIIHPDRDVRSHFISFLYRCRVVDHFVLDNMGRMPGTPGFLKWHDGCPDDVIDCHTAYRQYMSKT